MQLVSFSVTARSDESAAEIFLALVHPRMPGPVPLNTKKRFREENDSSGPAYVVVVLLLFA
jgi:hypothetical protein